MKPQVGELYFHGVLQPDQPIRIIRIDDRGISAIDIHGKEHGPISPKYLYTKHDMQQQERWVQVFCDTCGAIYRTKKPHYRVCVHCLHRRRERKRQQEEEQRHLEQAKAAYDKLASTTVYEPSLPSYESLPNVLDSATAMARKMIAKIDGQIVSVKDKARLEWMRKIDHPFIPTNEFETIWLFAQVAPDLGLYAKQLKANLAPDGVFLNEDGEIVFVEFEYVSGNFLTHKHNPDTIDLVICWSIDRRLPVPTIPLEPFYEPYSQTWDFTGLAAFISSCGLANSVP